MSCPPLPRPLALPTWIAVGMGLGLNHCALYASAPRTDDPFELLRQRRLGDFSQSLEADKHAQRSDDWTIVGEQWRRLLHCLPMMEAGQVRRVPKHALARLQLALLDIERQRRGLMLSQSGNLEGTAFADWRDPQFFSYALGRITSDDVQVIHWPAEEEAWADESLAGTVAHKPENDCAADEPATSEARARALHRALTYSLGRIEHLQTRFETIQFVALHRDLALFTATLVNNRYWAMESDDSSDVSSDGYWRAAAKQLLATADRLPAAPGATIALGHATIERDATRTRTGTSSIQHFSKIDETTLSPANRWLLRYALLDDPDVAARMLDQLPDGDRLPPRDHDLFAAFAYRAAMAELHRGHEAGFMAVAIQALRDTGSAGSPFLLALQRRFNERLVLHGFAEETVELLEEMGPRGETYERVAMFAQTAINGGFIAVTEAAAQWLLGRDQDRRHHPRYHGLIARAAFERDDAQAFRNAVGQIVARPKRLITALPRGRRASFFGGADEALTQLFVQLMPRMAEWGEGANARARRRRWLTVVVLEVQNFLRETDETHARDDLIAMYRLASALLSAHSRNYVEAVGQKRQRAMVLGDVKVENRDLATFEPLLRVDFVTLYLLAPIPLGNAAPSAWAAKFAPQIGDGTPQREDKS